MIKDVQNQKDLRNIPIQKVGVKDVEIPLKIERKLKIINLSLKWFMQERRCLLVCCPNLKGHTCHVLSKF